jgi:hypothetical protein
MTDFRQIKFPKSRIATIDICDVGQQKHHVTALIEIDVTEALNTNLPNFRAEKIRGKVQITG